MVLRAPVTFLVALAVLLALWAELGAQEAATDTRIISQADEAPESCRKLLDEAFKAAPAGTKLKITLAQFFTFGKMDVTPFLQSCVPLDSKGRPHGPETIYERIHDSARPKRITPWTHGKREGLGKEYDNKWQKGETPWVDDAIHGVRRTFHRNGKVRTETTYVKGRIDGPSRTRDKEGRLVRESASKNGIRQGDMIDYWPATGRRKRVVPYVKGAVHGVVKEFYASGQLKTEAPYQKDGRHGIERHFDADGTLTRLRHWRDDEQVHQ